MSRQLPERVVQKLENLPDSPGCYLMYNGDNKVIYVGKAVVLKNRVRSYFHASAQHTPKTQTLVAEIEDINWWVTGSELEALILENELIKRYRPRYNVRLKDDKQFPYIKVNWQEEYPKIEVVRRVHKDGARYFGPYTSGRACYQTLDALRRIFPYLDCERTITGNDERPCLYYHIKMCGGPCIGRQTRDEYRAVLQQLMDFLSGDTDLVLKQLEMQMERAAENLQFELAALYRDRLKSATKIAEQQQVVNTRLEDADYVALAQDEKTGDTAVQVFMIRRGRIIGRESVLLEGTEVPQADINQQGMLMSAFLPQFYDALAFVPPMILVQAMPDDWQVLEEWLSQKRGTKVELRLPQRGAKRQLMAMAQQNATEFLRLRQAEWAADTNRQTQALDELQKVLNLDTPPNRIECYDISTFQGENTVGSMVVFAQGAPLKNAYKRFKIRGKGSQGSPDDFASMREMLRRRFRRLVEENDDPDPGKKARGSEDTWKMVPDLVIVDGGKGQLGIAVEVFTELGLMNRIPLVSLAKREEEIFRPGESQSTWLTRGSQALFLVQRIRDEAHRFAITYHRNLRGKAQTKSLLDEVKGIGPARRKALLTYYGGDIEKIRAATLDELIAVPGMNRKSAEAIKEYL